MLKRHIIMNCATYSFLKANGFKFRHKFTSDVTIVYISQLVIT